MGKYDDAMFRYLSDNNRFADLFNGAVFSGEEIVQGDMLESGSERYVSVGLQEDSIHTVNHVRDLKKRMKNGNWLAVTAVENQEAIDYTMPLRMMQYDCLEYEEQVRRLQSKKRKELSDAGLEDFGWNTRLTGEDKLYPVYSLCFYHGTEEWKGPKSLKDMMNFEGAPPRWQELFHDYGMTLFCANAVKDFSVFRTGLRQLLQVIPYRRNKKKLWELWKQDAYKHLDKETAETIMIMTDAGDILEHMDDYKTEEGYDMCQAMDELKQDWLAEGRECGITQGIAQGIEGSIRNLMSSMKWTAEQAMDALLVPENERAGYLERMN